MVKKGVRKYQESQYISIDGYLRNYEIILLGGEGRGGAVLWVLRTNTDLRVIKCLDRLPGYSGFKQLCGLLMF